MPSELAIIERAEMYLRKLSCGVNPLTDSPLLDDDSCKQERISKCLSYVADLLRQKLNAAQKNAPKQPKKEPQKVKPALKALALDAETLSHYQFFDYPVSISKVIRNVNALIPAGENMNHLLYADVANFLVQEGILSRQNAANGKEANLPTTKGEQYGFEQTEADLRGHHNIYTQCWQNGQQFIIDNIQKCIDIANERLARKNATTDEAAPRSNRKRFYITQDDLKNYPVDDTPIPVSEIARRINTLVKPDTERIFYKVIRDWFVDQKYLDSKKNLDGKISFVPTEAGILAGITTEKRIGKNGETYDAILYNGNAQKVFLDHLIKDNA